MFEQQSEKDCNPKLDLLWLKAILYRIVRMFIVFWSSWYILDDTTIALSIMSVDVLAATVFYWGFDKSWPWIHKKITHLILLWKYRKMN